MSLMAACKCCRYNCVESGWAAPYTIEVELSGFNICGGFRGLHDGVYVLEKRGTNTGTYHTTYFSSYASPIAEWLIEPTWGPAYWAELALRIVVNLPILHLGYKTGRLAFQIPDRRDYSNLFGAAGITPIEDFGEVCGDLPAMTNVIESCEPRYPNYPNELAVGGEIKILTPFTKPVEDNPQTAASPLASTPQSLGNRASSEDITARAVARQRMAVCHACPDDEYDNGVCKATGADGLPVFDCRGRCFKRKLMDLSVECPRGHWARVEIPTGG